MKFVIFTILCVTVEVFTIELPSYIPKCSRSTTSMNKCIKDNANIAIPLLAKGNADFGIPVMSPLHLPRVDLNGRDLNIVLINTDGYGLENVEITDVYLDPNGAMGNFTATLDVFTLLGYYSIPRGRILSRRVSGNGKLNMTLVGNSIDYHTDIVLFTKDGKMYYRTANTRIDLNVKYVEYLFDNLKSPEAGIKTIIDDNWQEIWNQVKPCMENYFLQCVGYMLRPIAYKLKMGQIFVP